MAHNTMIHVRRTYAHIINYFAAIVAIDINKPTVWHLRVCARRGRRKSHGMNYVLTGNIAIGSK